ncbi:hypothetical protein [Nitrospirillum iridis]|uniref:Uncharacterized protein n=1 Tax=Nitrospirillum iridis TaxID=765888 RepID=A0A7X0AYV1_9PROT|nr:hypothetical protein [Nitrospirillum iridis]MBB6251211.1 hypothetical protein [Nitrospirillum iridis]
MNISSIGGSAAYTPLQSATPTAAAAAPAPAATQDSDHDGDRDVPGVVDKDRGNNVNILA